MSCCDSLRFARRYSLGARHMVNVEKAVAEREAELDRTPLSLQCLDQTFRSINREDIQPGLIIDQPAGIVRWARHPLGSKERPRKPHGERTDCLPHITDFGGATQTHTINRYVPVMGRLDSSSIKHIMLVLL